MARTSGHPRRAEQRGEGRVPYQIEYRLHSEVDGMRWIRDRGEVVDSSQNGGRYLVGVSMDITDQRKRQRRTASRASPGAHEARKRNRGSLAAMSHEPARR